MKNLLDEIVGKIKNDYNSYLDCEENRSDLFWWIDGLEVSIKGISEDMVYFEDSEYDCLLLESDIALLVYINNCI